MAFKSPTTTGDPDDEWTAGDNIRLSDNRYATESTIGDKLDTSEYGFSFITSDGNFLTFDGIEVKLEAKSDDLGAGCPGVGSNHVVEIALSVNGGSTYSRTTKEITYTCPGESTDTVGSATDVWGFRNLTIDSFSDANFRCRLELTEKNIGAQVFAADQIQVQLSKHLTRFVCAGGFFDRSETRVVYAG